MKGLVSFQIILHQLFQENILLQSQPLGQLHNNCFVFYLYNELRVKMRNKSFTFRNKDLSFDDA